LSSHEPYFHSFDILSQLIQIGARALGTQNFFKGILNEFAFYNYARIAHQEKYRLMRKRLKYRSSLTILKATPSKHFHRAEDGSLFGIEGETNIR